MLDIRQQKGKWSQRGSVDRAGHVWHDIEELLKRFVSSTPPRSSSWPPDINELVEALSEPVFRMARTILWKSRNPDADAEEAVQTWLAKMLEKFPFDYNFARPVFCYAYPMFLHVCADIGRQHARHDGCPPPMDIASCDVGPTEQAELSELRSIVDAGLKALPEDRRQALREKYWLGHRSRQAADRMGIKVGSYNRKTHEGRQKMRGYMMQWPELCRPFQASQSARQPAITLRGNPKD